MKRKLQEIEIANLKDTGKTVLLQRIEPQPEPCKKYGRNGWAWFLKYSAPQWGDTPEEAVSSHTCPFGKSGETVNIDGLNLRITSVDVVEPDDSTGWFWRVGVEVVK